MGDNSSAVSSTDCSQVQAALNSSGVPVRTYPSVSTQGTELVVYVVNTTILVLSVVITGLFMRLRFKQYDRLKARSFPLVVAGHLGALVQLQTGSLAAILADQVPCNWHSVFSLMVVPLVLLPVSVKLIQLRKQDLLTRAAAKGLELDLDADKPSGSAEDMVVPLEGGSGERIRTSARISGGVSRLISQSRRFAVLIFGGDPDGNRISKKVHTVVTTMAAESAATLQTQTQTSASNLNTSPSHGHRSNHQSTTLIPSQLLEEGDAVSSPRSPPSPAELGPSSNEILWLRYSAGSWGTLLTLALVNLPFFLIAVLAFAFIHPIYSTSCLGCMLSPTHYSFIASEGTLALALMIFLMRTTKINSDPFGVKQEIWLAILTGALPALLSFILYFSKVPVVDGFSFNVLVSGFLVVGSLWQGLFQVFLAMRDAREIRKLHEIGVEVVEGGGDSHNNNNNATTRDVEAQNSQSSRPMSGEVSEGERRDRVESLVKPGREGESGHTRKTSSSRVVSVGVNYAGLLQMVLADPVFRNAFHAHLCDEHNVEPLSFIDAVDRWKRHFGGSTPETSHRRAKRIIKSFVGPRAPFKIPLSSSQVDTLIRKTARPEAITAEAFDGARVEMLKVLEYGPLVRFTKSGIWKGFVEDGLVAENDFFTNPASPLQLAHRALTRTSLPGGSESGNATPVALLVKTPSSRSAGRA